MSGIELTVHGADALDDALAVMTRAFEPVYGEAWTHAQCMGVLSMPGTCLLVARNPQPVGFALLRTVIDETELMLLAVIPEARRTGLGRAILEQSFAVAANAGSKHYFLEVRSDNPAISLYRKLGLLQVGMRREYYRGGDGVRRDALTFKRTLG